MFRGYRPLLVTAIIISLSIYVAAQDQHANQARGFNPNGVYSSFDLDHINLFSGNLVVLIPIGQKYPVGGNLSYNLTLVYNSYLWSQREVCKQDGVLNRSFFTTWVDYRLYQETIIRHFDRPAADGNENPRRPPAEHFGDDGCYTLQYPNPGANAGMGWQLTFGRLYNPTQNLFSIKDRAITTEKEDYVFQAPDGSEHTFYHTLHVGEAIQPNVFYTRDGSYLRLTTYNNVYEIQFPNGIIYTFGVAPNGLPEETELRVTHMRDQLDTNWVNISYTATRWTITDSVGRTHTVNLASQASEFPNVVTSVQLDAFNGTKDTYNLSYFPKTIQRALPHVPPGVVEGLSDSVSVPFLTSVVLPDGRQQYTMPDANATTGAPAAYDFTGEFSSTMASGVLRKLFLPTGSSIEWEYRGDSELDDVEHHYGYPLASSARGYVRLSIGVRKRIVREGQRTYVWKYEPTSERAPAVGTGGEDCSRDGGVWWTAPCAPRLFINTVTTPRPERIQSGVSENGYVTKNYFSFYPHPWNTDGRNIYDWHVAEYGLPMNKSVWRMDHNNQPVFLSSETFDLNGNLARSEYVRYETDQWPQADGWGNIAETNARVEAAQTVYNDDPGKFSEVQFSDFDGLGHYRKVETFGNLGNDYRVEITNYNPNSGTYRANIATNSRDTSLPYTPYTGTRWVLETYDKKLASEFNQRSMTYYKFDPEGTGLLNAKRTRKEIESDNTNAYSSMRAADVPVTLGGNDVLVSYSYDSSGNMVGESYFGGDKPGHVNLDTGNAFPTVYDSNSEHKINYGYQCVKANNATGKTSVVSDKSFRGANYKLLDNTIDCYTGLPKSSRDTAGVETKYEYTSMGRVSWIKPAQGAYVNISYDPAVGFPATGTPRVISQHLAQGPNGVAGLLSEEIYLYDTLGRLNTEKKRMPDGSYQARVTNQNALGWTTDVSEWTDGSNNETRKTTYSLFDPFGRPARITTPDNKVVIVGYQGARQQTRTVNIGSAVSGTGFTEVSSTTKELYDRQGRLTQVIEPVAAGEQNTTWVYFYNVNSNVAGASVTDPSSNISQNRSFSYDNLGNLLAQSIPERPWSQFFDYDTLGNLGKSYDGRHWLQYTYDNLSRPTAVNELVEATWQWRPMKVFSYYDVNDGTGGAFPVGRLKSSTRHNYVLNPYEAHQNVALGKTATQSSVAYNGVPSIAVDGNTNGSVNFTHTNNDYHAWWQVDLGAGYSLEQIIIWNRTNFCCPERLSNFYVLVSDTPFTSTDLNAALTQPGVSSYYVGGLSGSSATVAIGRSGRYVRVQLAGTNYLSLAEVQVIGTSPTIYDVGVTEQYAYSGLDGRVSKRTTSTTIPNGPAFEQSYNYTQLGALASQTYPKCTNAECVQSGVQRPWSVNYGYTNGFLTSVGGGAGEANTTADTYAPSITYNVNGTVNTVTHRNNVQDLEEMDLNNMQRPRRITVSRSGALLLDTKVYAYDGAGNITRIGDDWYLYDKANRLKEGTALFSPDDPLKRLKQQYDYDAFGNRLTTRTYNNVSPAGATLKDAYVSNVNSATNRLALNYDGAGNTLGVLNQPQTYTYDALNMIVTAPGLTYIYGPDEERFWILDTRQDNDNSNNEDTFTLRGLNNEVLREYKTVGGNAAGRWFWQKDYVYRGGTLLAAETPSGVRHYHVDHLGSPRVITDAGGAVFEQMKFLPFGENSGWYQNNESWSLANSSESVPTRLRFTGHEKDSDVLGLDYMHARHFWERNGKFMSVDPGADWDPKRPQSWNLYSYTRNNPVNADDPTGRDIVSRILSFLDRFGIGPSQQPLETPGAAEQQVPAMCQLRNPLTMSFGFTSEPENAVGHVRHDSNAGGQFWSRRTTGGFAHAHGALDLAGVEGVTRVHPIAPGTVIQSGYDKFLGYYVQLRHADWLTSSYGHLAPGSIPAYMKKSGARVDTWMLLGLVGTSGNGNVPQPHLHLITYVRGERVNPAWLLNSNMCQWAAAVKH